MTTTRNKIFTAYENKHRTESGRKRERKATRLYRINATDGKAKIF
jgi:hypothetical protein